MKKDILINDLENGLKKLQEEEFMDTLIIDIRGRIVDFVSTFILEITKGDYTASEIQSAKMAMCTLWYNRIDILDEKNDKELSNIEKLIEEKDKLADEETQIDLLIKQRDYVRRGIELTRLRLCVSLKLLRLECEIRECTAILKTIAGRREYDQEIADILSENRRSREEEANDNPDYYDYMDIEGFMCTKYDARQLERICGEIPEFDVCFGRNSIK